MNKYHQLIGPSGMDLPRMAEYIREYEAAFDFAKQLPPTSGFLDFDVSEMARPFMIDGVKEFLQIGCPEDAWLWLLLGWTAAINRIVKSGSVEAGLPYRGAYESFLAAMDLANQAGYERKASQGHELNSACMDFAQSLIAKNPQIVR